MDTGWIQIFVLTIAECVAPAGKTVCQQSQFELQFLTRADCEVALEQFVSLKKESEKVIVDPGASGCRPSAVERETFESLAAINEANRDTVDWQAPETKDNKPRSSSVAHQQRLESLKTCEDTGGLAPCKIGSIIIEDADEDDVEVWRRD